MSYEYTPYGGHVGSGIFFAYDQNTSLGFLNYTGSHKLTGSYHSYYNVGSYLHGIFTGGGMDCGGWGDNGTTSDGIFKTDYHVWTNIFSYAYAEGS